MNTKMRWLATAIAGVALVALPGCPSKDGESYPGGKSSLPVAYEWNLGQLDGRYQFLARGAGMNLFLAPTEMVVDLGNGRGTVHAQFEGANAAAQAERLGPPDTMTNYFIGADPTKWITDVPMYGRVRYRDVYQGIDVEYHGQDGNFEHDFVVRPGADPSKIRVAFAGADAVTIDAEGNLAVKVGEHRTRWQKPVLYQQHNGRKTAVEGSYRLGSDQVATFSVGAYDRSQDLVIDPIIQYLTYVGRSRIDGTTRMAADASGNVYLTGITRDIDFPVSPGAFQVNPNGASLGNVIVVKMNASGTGVTYVTHFGGANLDYGTGIAVDGAGNAYLAGGTESENFPVTIGALKTTFTSQNPGASHCFVTKLNAGGNALVYSTYLGGRGTEQCYGIAVDGGGNAYVTGRTSSTNFPVTEGALQANYRGGVTQLKVGGSDLNYLASDAFVTKLNPTGTGIVYSTFYGGSSNDLGSAIAVDGAGNAFVTGVTNSPNFPVTDGAVQKVFGGAQGQNDFLIGDAFVLKLNAAGTNAVYSTYLGGKQNEVALGLAVDGQGNAYVTGSTNSRDFPATSGAFQTEFKGAGGEQQNIAGDVFVTKLNAAGTGLVYSTYVGGSRDERATAIALDATGNAWITGNTLSNDFPTTADGLQRVYLGQPATDVFQMGDAFVTQLDAAGRTLRSSSYLAGRGADGGTGIAVLLDDSVFVSGLTSSSDLPVTTGAYQRSYFGTTGTGNPFGDIFVTRLGGGSAPTVGGLASAASYVGGTVAPGEIVVLAGTWIGPTALATAALTEDGKLSNSLLGTRVLFDDVPAALIYVSAGQTSAIVPYAVAGRPSTRVVVEYQGNRSVAVTMPVVASKPALFSANSTGRGQGAILNQDGSPNTVTNRAVKGSVIVLFGTGEGVTAPAGVDGQLALAVFPKPVLPVTVTLGGQRIETIAYVGAAPGLVAGLFQLNVTIPGSAPSGEVPIAVTVGGATSQTGLTVAIQ